jgi:hypothetical protein
VQPGVLQEQRSTDFVEPEALALSHDPRLQLLIDIINQSAQRGTAEPAVITDPPAKERIDLLGISASVADVCRGMCKLRIVDRMDFRAVGLTAGV